MAHNTTKAQGQDTTNMKDGHSFVNRAFSVEENGSETIIRRKSANANGLQLESGGGGGGVGGFNNTKSPPTSMDFDDILPMIGEFGKSQKILFLCMIPFAFFVAFVYFSQIFMTLVPEQHWCNIPELNGLPLLERYVHD